MTPFDSNHALEQAKAEVELCRRDLLRRMDEANPGYQPTLGLKNLFALMRSAVLRGLRPRKHVDPVEWAEKLTVPKETSPAQHGPLRLNEYQKQLLRAMVAPGARFVTVPKSVQIGYSLVCALAIFYVLAHLGLPAAYVSKSNEEVDKFVKQFVNPMLREKKNTVLTRIVRKPGQNEDKDLLNERFFKNGAVFYARTAASDDAARGFTAWIVLCDEVDADEWIARSGGQGNKVDLFRARFTRFHDGRIIVGGSPSHIRTLIVEKEFALSDQRRLFVPCPHCSGVVKEGGVACDDPDNPPNGFQGFQVLKMGDGDPALPGFFYTLRKSDRSVEQIAYQCEFDPKHQIAPKSPKPNAFNWKEWMDRHSEFRPTAAGGAWHRGKYPGEWWQELERDEYDPESGEIVKVPIPTSVMPGHVGLRVWAGYNPSVSWELLAEAKLEAERKGIASIRTFVNNFLGEAFTPRTLFVEQALEKLNSNCLAYPAQIPDNVIFLVAGIDAQQGTEDGAKAKRVEISIYGIGLEDTVYFVAHYAIDATPGSGQLYDARMNAQIDATLDRTYFNESGQPLQVVAAGHDCNYEPRLIYTYAQKNISKNRLAVRSFSDKTGEGCKYGSIIDLKHRGKDGFRWYFVDSLLAKDELAHRLALGPRIGGIFFPRSASLLPGFFKGLQAERRNPYKQGWKWEIKGHTPNEPLDCFVYAMAARDYVIASSALFSDFPNAVKLLKWTVPDTPSLLSTPWVGDCQSVQMATLVPSIESMTPGGIRDRAAAAIERPAPGSRVHPGLLRKPLPQHPDLMKPMPQITVADRLGVAAEMTGWSGGSGKTGGWRF